MTLQFKTENLADFFSSELSKAIGSEVHAGSLAITFPKKLIQIWTVIKVGYYDSVSIRADVFFEKPNEVTICSYTNANILTTDLLKKIEKGVDIFCEKYAVPYWTDQIHRKGISKYKE